MYTSLNCYSNFEYFSSNFISISFFHQNCFAAFVLDENQIYVAVEERLFFRFTKFEEN